MGYLPRLRVGATTQDLIDRGRVGYRTFSRAYSGDDCSVPVGTSEETYSLSEQTDLDMAFLDAEDTFDTYAETFFTDVYELKSKYNMAAVRGMLVTGVSQIWATAANYFYNLNLPVGTSSHAPGPEPEEFTLRIESMGDSKYRTKYYTTITPPVTGYYESKIYDEVKEGIEMGMEWSIERPFKESRLRESRLCILTDHQVKSFDGLRTNVTLGKDPLVLATSAADWAEPLGITAIKGKEGITLTFAIADFFIVATHNHLTVNGVEVTPNVIDQYARVHVEHDGMNMKVDVLSQLFFVLREDKASIWLPERHGDGISGVCGDKNGEPSNDAVTPDGCFLSHPDESLSKVWLTEDPIYSDSVDCYKGPGPKSDIYPHF